MRSRPRGPNTQLGCCVDVKPIPRRPVKCRFLARAFAGHPPLTWCCGHAEQMQMAKAIRGQVVLRRSRRRERSFVAPMLRATRRAGGSCFAALTGKCPRLLANGSRSSRVAPNGGGATDHSGVVKCCAKSPARRCRGIFPPEARGRPSLRERHDPPALPGAGMNIRDSPSRRLRRSLIAESGNLSIGWYPG